VAAAGAACARGVACVAAVEGAGGLLLPGCESEDEEEQEGADQEPCGSTDDERDDAAPDGRHDIHGVTAIAVA
jgi:hypothetical protein